jgi:hypothetical protein
MNKMKKRKDRHTQKKEKNGIACLIAAKCTVQCATDKLRGQTHPLRKTLQETT